MSTRTPPRAVTCPWGTHWKTAWPASALLWMDAYGIMVRDWRPAQVAFQRPCRGASHVLASMREANENVHRREGHEGSTVNEPWWAGDAALRRSAGPGRRARRGGGRHSCG